MATPQGSQLDELDYWMRQADELYDLARRKKINQKKFIRRAEQLDSVPGAGEYFRHLCSTHHPSQLRLDKLVINEDPLSCSQSSNPAHPDCVAPAEISPELAELHQQAWLSLYGGADHSFQLLPLEPVLVMYWPWSG